MVTFDLILSQLRSPLMTGRIGPFGRDFSQRDWVDFHFSSSLKEAIADFVLNDVRQVAQKSTISSTMKP